jgi:predicted RNase H-like HicB family nuclease
MRETFWAEGPALPDCDSQGESIDELIRRPGDEYIGVTHHREDGDGRPTPTYRA